jgi:hypothetical protein
MKTSLAKTFWRGLAFLFALLILLGVFIFPRRMVIAQPVSPAPSTGLVKATPTPNPPKPQAEKPEAPQTGKAEVTPASTNPSARAETKGKQKVGASGPYDMQAIEESYKSLYGS